MANISGRAFVKWLTIVIGSINIGMSVLTYFLAFRNYSDPLAPLTDPGPVLAVSASLVGMLVAYRRPSNPLGWIYLAIGFSQSLVAFSYEYATYTIKTQPGSLPGGELMAFLGETVWMPGLALLFTFALLLFPTGRLPSRGWRLVAWPSAIVIALSILYIGFTWESGQKYLLENPQQVEIQASWFDQTITLIIFPVILICGILSTASLFIRYFRSSGIEWQQLKWITYAAVVTVAGVGLLHSLFSGTIASLLFMPLVPSIPAAAGIAILRYRLWDIDLIIRRTLMYSVLSAALALVYFVTVLLLQASFRGITGLDTQVAVVLSTLVIAAMFSPLRGRIQRFIDRRFFRRRYNAEQTLESYSTQMKNLVDLDEIQRSFITIVEQNMQPQSIEFWLIKK